MKFTRRIQMKRTRFTDEQIVRALKEYDNGRKVPDICRELSISEGTFYRWRSKYGGMDVADTKRLKALEDENRRLKRMVAEQALDIDALKEALQGKY